MTSNHREPFQDIPNPLGLDGVEFIEYATTKPQALGQVLETMGFKPIARHRSREVMLYRQGDINIIVNAHEAELDSPKITAIAFRVRDANAAYTRAVELGAWAVPTHVEVMELNIPAIHGVGSSRIYFVDRHKEFSIYDVDFVTIPGVDKYPPSVQNMHLFGVVQYIGNDRSEDWIEFYKTLFGFDILDDSTRFGILPKGHILRSPCNQFYLQLIEPEPGILDVEDDERLHRIGLGVRDVIVATNELRKRGVEFVESKTVHTADKGALTRTFLGTVMFELVHDDTRQIAGA